MFIWRPNQEGGYDLRIQGARANVQELVSKLLDTLQQVFVNASSQRTAG